MSVLPGGGGGGRGATPGSGEGSVRGAISADGSRVFWTPRRPRRRGLYVRDTARGETARLDVVQPGAFGTGKADPLFQGADADGHASPSSPTPGT